MEIFSPPFAPFTVALLLLAIIAVIEIAGLIVGAGVSDLLESALPDFDVEAPGGGDLVARALGWLHVGKVPALIILATWLACFGVVGLTLQNAASAVFGAPLPALLAAPLSLIAALPAARVLCGGLARILPREETDAVSSDSFIGRVAEVIRGEARVGAPAEAKLTDARGQTQYILVEPDAAGASFHQGTEVLIVEQRGAVFRAAENRTAALSRNS